MKETTAEDWSPTYVGSCWLQYSRGLVTDASPGPVDLLRRILRPTARHKSVSGSRQCYLAIKHKCMRGGLNVWMDHTASTRNARLLAAKLELVLQCTSSVLVELVACRLEATDYSEQRCSAVSLVLCHLVAADYSERHTNDCILLTTVSVGKGPTASGQSGALYTTTASAMSSSLATSYLDDVRRSSSPTRASALYTERPSTTSVLLQ